jgi:hypothetical protein
MKIINVMRRTLLAGVAAFVGGGVTSSRADMAGIEVGVGDVRSEVLSPVNLTRSGTISGQIHS